MKYFRPSTLDEAISQLQAAGPKAKIFAGGTDLVVQMRILRRIPEAVVDIKHIPELRQFSRNPDGGWTLGAAVAGAEITEHAEFTRDYPGFAEGTGLIGSMQVQSRGTPIGNLCNGSPAADSVPGMIAAGAMLDLVGPEGRRCVAVEDFVQGPGRVALEPGEIVTHIHFPPRAPRACDAYLRFTPRTEMDIAVSGVAINLGFDSEGTCSFARMALGAVGPKAVLVPAAELLIGTKLQAEVLNRLGEVARAAASPIDDKRGTAEFRLAVTPVLAKRAAKIARARALELSHIQDPATPVSGEGV